jgi:alpha-glucosidase
MANAQGASQLALAVLLAAPATGGAAAFEVVSPGHVVQATLAVDPGGVVRYGVRRRGRPVIEGSTLGLVFDGGALDRGFTLVGHARSRRSADWKPLYGERAVIPDRYEAMTIDLASPGPLGRRLSIELRAYDEGVAFRYVLPPGAGAQTVREERSEFRFAVGSVAWPIYEAEETFPTEPVPLDRLKAGAHTPLTVRTPAGFASVLDADVADYPRIRLDPAGDGALVTRLLGPAATKPGSPMPWRVVLLGESEARLVENAHLVPTLNPPCAIADTSWIRPGKTISNEGSAPLQTAPLERVIDFAAENAIRYLQLDWGWYGTEWTWTDAERDTFRRRMPAWAARTDWVPNTFADPSRVAHGPVPYRPDWESFTDVDLDLPALIRHGKEKGVGVCLYVEAEHTLRRVADLDRLFATYREWGVAGLKPGFVPVGTQEDTRWIRRLVETAARHRLWLCVHDAHVPDGMERTWPNLFISEGGGGQEGNHPASHDVTLPFTRNLAGPFDYTPRLYTGGKSHAHLLAFLVVYYAPAPTIRGGYPAWHGDAEFGRGGDEIEFLRRVPVTWDETRVLDARIGRRVVVARRSGESWFLGGMSGAAAEGVDVALPFLARHRAYAARIFRDAPAADGPWRPVRLETRTVGPADRLALTMEPAGGFVAILDPVPVAPSNGRR